MRKFSLLSLLVFFSFLTACEVTVDSPGKGKTSDPTAVGFGVYMKRGVTTKAGYAGELTTEKLKGVAVGFGVFGYYGNGAMYNETMKPDFMYNQWVKFTGNNVWEYSPIKYWPNEFGQAAGSEAADRLTFFAYAPYVEVTPSTGIVTDTNDEDGILGMTRNISAGDPQVMYGARLQPGGGVDLCWGVAASDFTSSVDGNNNKVDKGKPFINLIKPKTGDKISFEFNHALTQLNVQIDADIDVESHSTSSLAEETRVYVRSVTFTGFTTRGSLNLNSVAGNPAWSDISGSGRLRRDPVTIYDGRSDGLEGVATAADLNETPATLSPKIIQSSPFDVLTVDGVTNTPVNMFSYADPANSVADVNAPVMVIPIAGVPVTVTIVYDVETADPNLAGYLSDGVTHGVSVENKITKTVQMSGQNMTLEAGKRYVIGLHLGMTSVKFDADVLEWTDAQYQGTANLPENSGVTPPTPPTTSFRGYNVSKGILERTIDPLSSEASYSLTTGDNQFEILGYYGVDENKGKYYHQWTKLKEELGADAAGNINASSNKLPDGWTMPGSADWKIIVFGAATGITVNGQDVTYGYALVSVSVGNESVPALLLVPDDTAIDLASLSGLETYFDEEDGDYGYDDILLSSDDYTYLMGKDCRFLPISGCFDNVVNHKWKHGMEDYYPEGYYWGYDHYETAMGQAYHLWVDYDDEWVQITTTTAPSDYYPVRLVKKNN